MSPSFYDLHVHLDGSINFDTARKLAKMQEMQIPTDTELQNSMVVSKNCCDLNEYLEKFEYPLSLLQTEEAIMESVYDLLSVQQKQGLVYSEIRFAPQLHQKKGLTQEAAVQAALDGLKQFEATNSQGKNLLNSGLILCCMRGADNFKENYETLEIAHEFLGQDVVAVDLAGAEGIYPTKNFKELFQHAVSLNLPLTIHAGEADGPGSVWEAVEFGASRIGHGVRCVEDRELMRRLAKDRIVLELCPTSNLQTKIFKDIAEYPIKQLLDAGIRVTINTDNMTVSNVTVQSESELIQKTFHFSEDEIKQILENSRYAAFKKCI